MFKNMAYYLRIGNETDDLHLPSTARTAEGVHLIDLFDTFTPLDICYPNLINLEKTSLVFLVVSC